jgi:hypothetical protein
MRGSLNTIRQSVLFACTAALLAVTYFAFQTELFEEEYAEQHPAPVCSSTVSPFSITWETFDRDNATPAFVIDVDLRVGCVLVVEPVDNPLSVILPRFHPVRDKSPPVA